MGSGQHCLHLSQWQKLRRPRDSRETTGTRRWHPNERPSCRPKHTAILTTEGGSTEVLFSPGRKHRKGEKRHISFCHPTTRLGEAKAPLKHLHRLDREAGGLVFSHSVSERSSSDTASELDFSAATFLMNRPCPVLLPCGCGCPGGGVAGGGCCQQGR